VSPLFYHCVSNIAIIILVLFHKAKRHVWCVSHVKIVYSQNNNFIIIIIYSYDIINTLCCHWKHREEGTLILSYRGGGTFPSSSGSAEAKIWRKYKHLWTYAMTMVFVCLFI